MPAHIETRIGAVRTTRGIVPRSGIALLLLRLHSSQGRNLICQGFNMRDGWAFEPEAQGGPAM